jgi:hypothetical protein
MRGPARRPVRSRPVTSPADPPPLLSPAGCSPAWPAPSSCPPFSAMSRCLGRPRRQLRPRSLREHRYTGPRCHRRAQGAIRPAGPRKRNRAAHFASTACGVPPSPSCRPGRIQEACGPGGVRRRTNRRRPAEHRFGLYQPTRWSRRDWTVDVVDEFVLAADTGALLEVAAQSMRPPTCRSAPRRRLVNMERPASFR